MRVWGGKVLVMEPFLNHKEIYGADILYSPPVGEYRVVKIYRLPRLDYHGEKHFEHPTDE